MTSTQLQIVPLALIMVMGPQILTAIFLVTSREPVKSSAAMLIGVFLAASLGLAIWTGVVQLISIDPSGNSGPGTGDYVVAGLLAVLAVRTVLTRGTATVPKWMSTLQHAEPRRAFSLGFLLILLMPTDIAATLATAHVLHDDGLSFVDGWPLVTATLALMAVPILGFLLLGHRARNAMPSIRDWLTTNAWLVNLIVLVYFIYQLLK
jgi:Sap, sulfolipid-1-addressing protein